MNDNNSSIIENVNNDNNINNNINNNNINNNKIITDQSEQLLLLIKVINAYKMENTLLLIRVNELEDNKKILQKNIQKIIIISAIILLSVLIYLYKNLKKN